MFPGMSTAAEDCGSYGDSLQYSERKLGLCVQRSFLVGISVVEVKTVVSLDLLQTEALFRTVLGTWRAVGYDESCCTAQFLTQMV